MIKLFIELINRSWFFFHDKPDRKLMKMDGSHYLSPEGRRHIHPLVGIIPYTIQRPRIGGLFDDKEGDSDDRSGYHSKDS